MPPGDVRRSLARTSGGSDYETDRKATFEDTYHYGNADRWSDCEDYALSRHRGWTNRSHDYEDWSSLGRQWE